MVTAYWSVVSLPVYLVRRLQSVLNAAERLIYHMRSADHITDVLVSLHWLRIPQRIEYKIVVLTYSYKALHGSAPLVPVADLPGRWALCSAGTSCLSVPSVMPNTHQRRRRDETVLSHRRCQHNSQLTHDDRGRIRSTIWKLTKETP